LVYYFVIFFVFFFFFFFQAEDGIRDATVTGVQTCALPICLRRAVPAPSERYADRGNSHGPAQPVAESLRGAAHRLDPPRVSGSRSEERRVGKECRSRWRTYE